MTEGMERVGIYRAAFRQILRHGGLDTEERIQALVNLAGHARSERYGDLIVRVMLAELEWSIDRDEVESARTCDDEMERAARKLRSEGRQKCPTCRAFLSMLVDWDYWRSLREAAIREAEARDGAA
jgi:hypothetical protein